MRIRTTIQEWRSLLDAAWRNGIEGPFAISAAELNELARYFTNRVPGGPILMGQDLVVVDRWPDSEHSLSMVAGGNGYRETYWCECGWTGHTHPSWKKHSAYETPVTPVT